MSRQESSRDLSSVTGLVLMVGGAITTVASLESTIGMQKIAEMIPDAEYLGTTTYVVHGILVIAGSTAAIHAIQKKIKAIRLAGLQTAGRELETIDDLVDLEGIEEPTPQCSVCLPPTPLKTFIWSMAGLTCLVGGIGSVLYLSQGKDWVEDNVISPLPWLSSIALAGFTEIGLGLLFGLGKGLHYLLNYKPGQLTSLLKTLNLSDADLKAAGIDKQALTVAANPSIYGRLLRFLMTTSLTGALLRWPFMQRCSIGVSAKSRLKAKGRLSIDGDDIDSAFPETGEELGDGILLLSSDNDSSSEDSKQKDLLKQSKGKTDAVTEEDLTAEDLSLLSDNDSNSEDSEQKGLLEQSGSKKNNTQMLALVPNDSDSEHFDALAVTASRCPWPVFTTSALPLRTQTSLRTVTSLNAFHDTTAMVLDGVWSALLSSLIIHNVINYALYPKEFSDNTSLLDVLGIANSLTLVCLGNKISQTEELRKYCAARQFDYEAVLARSLNEPFIWPVLFGLPVVFGLIDAISKALNTRRLVGQRLQKQIAVLRAYRPGFWPDVMGWVVSTAVPDILAAFIPPTVLFSLLPQPEIKRALEAIRTHVIWDGQLSAKNRIRLFNTLLNFSRTRTRFTQMKALSMLADIVTGIQLGDLTTLQEQGVSQANITALMQIKVQALSELRHLAKYYNLPDRPSHYLRPLPRFMYANYLTWCLGHRKHWYLEPVYFAYKGVKLYFNVIFYQTLVLGTVYLAKIYEIRKDCEEVGGTFQVSNQLFDYICICGDVKTGFLANNKFIFLNCPGDYLRLPRYLEDVFSLLSRIKIKSEGDHLDLSSQGYIIQQRQLPSLLHAIQSKTTFRSLTIRNHDLDLLDAQALSNFIRAQSRFSGLDLSGCRLKEGGFPILLQALVDRNDIYVLDFSGYLFSNLTEVRLLADVILQRQPSVRLTLDRSYLGDMGTQLLSDALPKIDALSLNQCNITSTGCVALVDQLIEKDTKLLHLTLSNNPIDSLCAHALARAIKQKRITHSLDLSGQNNFSDAAILAIAGMFNNTSSSFQDLDLSGRDVSEAGLSSLFGALPNSKLSSFGYSYYHTQRRLNYTHLLPKLAQALNQSKIHKFAWHSPNGDGLSNATILIWANYAQQGLLNRISTIDFGDNQIGSGIVPWATSNLNDIRLQRNNISAVDIQALSQSIKNLNTSIGFSRMDLSGNNIGNLGVSALAEVVGYFFPPRLLLAQVGMADQGLQALIQSLSRQKKHIIHPLWIDIIRFRTTEIQKIYSSTAFTLYLKGNHFGKPGLNVLCEVLSKTDFRPFDFGLTFTLENISLIEKCLYKSAGSRHMEHWMLWPLFRHMGPIKRVLSSYTSLFYKNIQTAFFQHPTENKYRDNSGYFASQNNVDLAITTAFNAHAQEKTIQSISIDFSHVLSNQLILIYLNELRQLAALVGETVVTSHHPVDHILGGIQNNHIFIGSDNTHLGLSQNHGRNFLIPGKNNKFILSANSQNHILITADLGTLTIVHWTDSDTLHFKDPQTLLTNHNTSCTTQNVNAQTTLSIILFKNTELHFPNTPCDTILPKITYNNETAIQEAQASVFQTTTPLGNILYTSLLSTCTTFIKSVGQSALLSTIPIFIAELCHQALGFTQAAAYTFAYQLQSELVLSFSHSLSAITANVLASFIASRLLTSPQIISLVGLTASLVATVAETLLTQDDAALAWVVLQAGVAMMGALVGGKLIQKFPQLSTWSYQKEKAVNDSVKNYMNHPMSFWSGREASNASYQDEGYIARELVCIVNPIGPGLRGQAA